MIELSLESISLVIACVSIVVGVASVVDKNRREVKTREANLVLQLLRWFNDVTFWEIYLEVIFGEKWTTWEEYEDRYGMAENTEDEAKVMAVAGWYDTLGTLARKNLVDIKSIYNTHSMWTIFAWEKLECVGKGTRKAYSHHGWGDFEWLANQFKRMEKEERKGEPMPQFSELHKEAVKEIEKTRKRKGSTGGHEG